MFLKPIGIILNKSTIKIFPKWNEALAGISGFSHIVVLFWMHKVTAEKRRVKKMRPCTINRPKGVLATRMPFRPNPIGLSIVRLIRRRKNILKIDGIDAYENTPVLDIKPYTGHPKDLVSNCRKPSWISKKRKFKKPA
ncbi:tRNA (N6-threonylcarbamoyladenosine(37)-N6)-methyltransferase TrmO [Candidatus Giovannonibacteria bacterium RIFCSPLOWO2_01_FULL_44_40]|uniref:tRNA (N6-threonylcarbamoyladenosine(37)-N6)-methyltransferase TrmO n=1 Tax=Candidatus Giovannonibacteria bacterium RIFCSPHIGHO2_01_FULL_45_23 TaxID=1798325 RepID=A0A1F5VJ72_9BACT|nr:MAG: tRNA (N6-threonylcarbamoyladenosine(37)-N6)-methyltransferase TrmO [Candidatus Giovannonibacteria bacterium RIFCSPHIGHO2_01_FULL_45_23]OGF75637.1 MAG: tRNA (N6-threonylcarbamoyladenosine(37)-N6)-methyltransferase TrmO [Candidatus Giovannonibacteria bacterium RIFCSPHIGHO2_02_FULL_45_13]OGF80061.1 MAG: tRNA (N6-threonylcarbamoyladenosine(37)-N6)-methyltransferase TrmO [Candidatus Giovannonibacteria bacterium RIFCSPLOWO2_01_FULL_44_40]